MASGAAIVLLGFGTARRELAGRLFLLGFRSFGAETVDEVRTLIGSRGPAAILVHTSAASRPVGSDLAGLRDAAQSTAPAIVAVGPRPDPRELDVLRRAGAGFGLFEPFHDGELRFVLNLSSHEAKGRDSRRESRVPTDLVATVFAATGEKSTAVYSLSRSGAYLETRRPTPAGGKVDILLPLPSGALRLAARVMTVNVPGNLQRPNLPMGMGVQFSNLEPRSEQAIGAYVDSRNGAYRL